MQSSDGLLKSEALAAVLRYLDENLEKAREHVKPGVAQGKDIQFIPPDIFNAMMRRSEAIKGLAATNSTAATSEGPAPSQPAETFPPAAPSAAYDQQTLRMNATGGIADDVFPNQLRRSGWGCCLDCVKVSA
jgi:hypothetical protein